MINHLSVELMRLTLENDQKKTHALPGARPGRACANPLHRGLYSNRKDICMILTLLLIKE